MNRRPVMLILLVVSVVTAAGFYAAPLLAQNNQPVQSGSAPKSGSFDCKTSEALCIVRQFSLPSEQLKTLTPPPYERSLARTVNYSIESRGSISLDISNFQQFTRAALNDSRGWSRLGVTFSEVPTGGEFSVVLAEAQEVARFSSGCDSTYSCNVGRYVIINQDRWLNGTPAWNQSGGSIEDYRRMVINHETGHWLGRDHSACPGPGQPAPVMQQQSINLAGCLFNPWPLKSELQSSTLGI